MRRLLQNATDFAEFDELARIHHRDIITEPTHDVEIVADKQEGDALVASEARQQAQDLRLDGDVEGRRRLVQNKQRRFTSQCGGDQCALLHPARKLMREGAGDLGGAIDPHLVQRGLGAPQRLCERQSEMLHHRLSDLPADPQRRVERRERILEDGPDPPPKDTSPLRRHELGEVAALEQDGASNFRRWSEKVQDCTSYTALAGPGFTDDGQRTSGLEREANIARGSDLPFTRGVADREITDLEQWRVHRRLPSFGLSISRNPSPTRLMPMTVAFMAIPG